MTLVLKNFRIVDEASDFSGSVIAENGIISAVYPGGGTNGLTAAAVEQKITQLSDEGGTVINGGGLVLMPAFIDLHAHFRDPGSPETLPQGTAFPAETVESACLAAAAGGYGAAVCMANTKPVTDTLEQAVALKRRADVLGLIDLFPAVSLTKGMQGKELSEFTPPEANSQASDAVRMFSEDGNDVAEDALFAKALDRARRAGIPVSCHCDLGGEDAATERVLELARRTGVRVHIAHVSTSRAAGLVRKARQNGIAVSCEVTPHHLALTEQDAAFLGAESFGKVHPPLRSESDRLAIIAALLDRTIDAVATDHAPHSRSGKISGAPGFSGLETAFAICCGLLTAPSPEGTPPPLSLSRLSSLMSASPARILGLGGRAAGRNGAPPRGTIAPGFRADFCAADTGAEWRVDSEAFVSRGKNSPFDGKRLRGKIVLTIHAGRIVFDRRPALSLPAPVP
jgi:dihydroorotase